jgi:hypothetical protein
MAYVVVWCVRAELQDAEAQEALLSSQRTRSAQQEAGSWR